MKRDVLAHEMAGSSPAMTVSSGPVVTVSSGPVVTVSSRPVVTVSSRPVMAVFCRPATTTPCRRVGETRGFTLIEVMIAVAILALIGGLVGGQISSAYNLKTRTEAADQRNQEIRGALQRMQREISMAFLSDHYDRQRFQERPSVFKGEHHFGEDKLTFTSFAHERLYKDAKESDQAIFAYTVEDEPGGAGRGIYRRVNPIIDDQWDRGGDKELMVPDVVGLQLEYWDAKDRQWREEWDAGSVERQGVLPPRVRITLTANDETGKERKYTTQTRVFIPRPLDF